VSIPLGILLNKHTKAERRDILLKKRKIKRKEKRRRERWTEPR
jgi:hypothetical protein